eukprot:356355-Chlamydomonas_euryale.AAC.1
MARMQVGRDGGWDGGVGGFTRGRGCAWRSATLLSRRHQSDRVARESGKGASRAPTKCHFSKVIFSPAECRTAL